MSGRGIRTKTRLAILILVPLVILGGMIYLFAASTSVMVGPIVSSQPLIEKLDIERLVFQHNEIAGYLVNVGPSELTVSQILVNSHVEGAGAMWEATVKPSNVIPRLGRATFTIPYAWVEGEPIRVTFITSNGFDFSKTIQAATTSVEPTLNQFLSLALLGVYVGVVPVYLGLGWRPALRNVSSRWFSLLLSFTAGLLAYLGVNTLNEALEVSGRIAVPFQGWGIILTSFTATFLGLQAIAAGRGRSMLFVAFMVALGIGLHNLGEGLAIGAAYSLGEIALGALLVIGFTVHNTTEGLAIIAPLSNQSVRVRDLGLLGVVAGAPTIMGAWIGGYVYSDLAAVLFLGIGAAAIFQVVYTITGFVGEGKGLVQTFSRLPNLLGVLLGFMLLYATGLMVPT